MPNYHDITLWYPEYKLTALSEVLKQASSSVEQAMMPALENLYEQMVPPEQRTAIAEKLAQEEQREAEEKARRESNAYRISAVEIIGEGERDYWKIRHDYNLLELATFLRETLRQAEQPPVAFFKAMLGEMEPLSEYDFLKLQTAKFQSQMQVNGVFTVDFHSMKFAFVEPRVGWQVYLAKDISTAVFRARQKSGLSYLDILRRLSLALDGMPHTTHPLAGEGEER
ncbi:Uncharacterised protein [uncultured Flavonifractor sp.]|nr:Uncharacterised protein [Flavonifractor plautii]SCJ23427.1 Uncharacterised protein [uncultured Flavonifractor sp.]